MIPALTAPIRLPLGESAEHACSYLPQRMARMRAVRVRSLPGELYRQFMDAGFRRSGAMLYQPICRNCRACIPLRVPVDRFHASKSQRRACRANADLSLSLDSPAPSEEKYRLYRRYVTDWHRGGDAGSYEDFTWFLYQSPVPSLEFCYRDSHGTLLAVGICDRAGEALSSVYFYFDPRAAHRRLGTFGAVTEIEHARATGLRYYYLGYWVPGCNAMAYKSNFRPCERLAPDGVWREVDDAAAANWVGERIPERSDKTV
jgi:arginine-tRNA-protein transferase